MHSLKIRKNAQIRGLMELCLRVTDREKEIDSGRR